MNSARRWYQGGGLLVVALLVLGGWMAPIVAEAQTRCRRVMANQMSPTKEDLTISTTPVVIAFENTARCSLLIYNNSTNPMRCRDTSSDGAVSATAGIIVPGGQGRTFETEAQGRWACIRSGAADALANIGEGLP